MAKKRKRKIDDKCRQFQKEWGLKYFFIKSAEKALCVICNETVAVWKEYNLCRRYRSKHQSNCSQLKGIVLAEKLAKLQHQIIAQRSLCTKSSNEDKSLTWASYKVAYVLGKRAKILTDVEIVNDCLRKRLRRNFARKNKTLQEFNSGCKNCCPPYRGHG